MRYKILLGIALTSWMVSSYMIKQNEVTTARVEIPKLFSEIKTLKEELRGMQYAADAIENPDRLLELAKQGEFSHLKFPHDCHIVKANETLLQTEETSKQVRSPLVVGSLQ